MKPAAKLSPAPMGLTCDTRSSLAYQSEPPCMYSAPEEPSVINACAGNSARRAFIDAAI